MLDRAFERLEESPTPVARGVVAGQPDQDPDRLVRVEDEPARVAGEEPRLDQEEVADEIDGAIEAYEQRPRVRRDQGGEGAGARRGALDAGSREDLRGGTEPTEPRARAL